MMYKSRPLKIVQNLKNRYKERRRHNETADGTLAKRESRIANGTGPDGKGKQYRGKSGGNDLTIAEINIRGINDAGQRIMLKAWAGRNLIDIICLPETKVPHSSVCGTATISLLLKKTYEEVGAGILAAGSTQQSWRK